MLIDFSRGITEAADQVRRHSVTSTAAISVVTKMELLVGCRHKAEIRQLIGFLKRFSVVKLDAPICDRDVSLLVRHRLSHGLLMPDSLVAATALICDFPLLSKNQRDYRFITGLHLLPYP